MEVIDRSRIEIGRADIKVRQVVAVFRVEMKGGPRDLVIEVVTQEDGKFLGVCNYTLWVPGMPAPYKALYPQETVEAAVTTALRGIATHVPPGFPADQLFWGRDPNPRALGGDELLDGRGRVLRYHLAWSMIKGK